MSRLLHFKYQTKESGIVEAKIFPDCCDDVFDLIELVRESFRVNVLNPSGVINLQFSNRSTIETTMSIHDLFVELGKMEEKDRYLCIQLLKPLNKSDLLESRLESLPKKPKKHYDLKDEILNLWRKKCLNRLVGTVGKDFEFCNREKSMLMITECFARKYLNSIMGETPGINDMQIIPFLAAAPGMGKSRLLDEFENQFKSLVINSIGYPEMFKNAVSSAPYINISFGNGTFYDAACENMDIKYSISSRILTSLRSRENRVSLNSFETEIDTLEIILDHLSSKQPDSMKHIVVLGIDEIDNLGFGVKLKGLLELLGALSLRRDVIFCPILAVTDISCLNQICQDINISPLFVPLPPLSVFDCQLIISNLLGNRALQIDTSGWVKAMLSIIDGHCRCFEIFYTMLDSYRGDLENFMERFRLQILNYYTLPESFKYAIFSFILGMPLEEAARVIEAGSNKPISEYVRSGLVFLSNNCYITIPRIFLWCYAQSYDTFKDYWFCEWLNFRSIELELSQVYVCRFALKLFACATLNIKSFKLKNLTNSGIPEIIDAVECLVPSQFELIQYQENNQPSSRSSPCFFSTPATTTRCESFIYLHSTSRTPILIMVLRIGEESLPLDNSISREIKEEGILFCEIMKLRSPKYMVAIIPSIETNKDLIQLHQTCVLINLLQD
jgi:hypothetical protein